MKVRLAKCLAVMLTLTMLVSLPSLTVVAGVSHITITVAMDEKGSGDPGYPSASMDDFKNVTLTTANSKMYGKDDPTIPVKVTADIGEVPNELLKAFTLTYEGEDVGSHEIFIDDPLADGLITKVGDEYIYNNTHKIVLEPSSFYIVPRPMDVAVHDATKTYGESDPAFLTATLTDLAANQYGADADWFAAHLAQIRADLKVSFARNENHRSYEDVNDPDRDSSKIIGYPITLIANTADAIGGNFCEPNNADDDYGTADLFIVARPVYVVARNYGPFLADGTFYTVPANHWDFSDKNDEPGAGLLPSHELLGLITLGGSDVAGKTAITFIPDIHLSIKDSISPRDGLIYNYDIIKKNGTLTLRSPYDGSGSDSPTIYDYLPDTAGGERGEHTNISSGGVSVDAVVTDDALTLIPDDSQWGRLVAQAGDGPVELDVSAFLGSRGDISEVGLLVPVSWFRSLGKSLLLNAEQIGNLTISDTMLGIITDQYSGFIEFVIGEGSLVFDIKNNGQSIRWSNPDVPIRLGAPLKADAEQPAVTLYNADTLIVAENIAYEDGVVYGDVFTTGRFIAELAGSAPEEAARSAYRVIASRLNVRSAPVIAGGNVVGTLGMNKIVVPEEIVDGWARITLENGVTGYCSMRYLAPFDTSATGERTAAANLNMRAGAGTQYPSLGILPRGASIDVTGYDGVWAIATAGGRTVYLHSFYLYSAIP